MSEMNEKEVKAQQYLSAADKKANSFNGLVGGLIGKSSSIEEACELYIKAANHFKMAQKWNEAGNAFFTSARLQRRIGDKLDSSLNFASASTCYVKCDPQKAVDCLLEAIAYYEDIGRLGISAKHYVTIADIYQNRLRNPEKAIQYYEMAADHFKAENSISSANKCLVNVANYLALQQNYDKAIAIYEEIGKHCIESSLLKYCGPTYFARASLCHLCIDLLNGELALKRYEEWFPSFGDSREFKLISRLISMIEMQDFDGFRETIRTYDSISRLEPWFVSLFLVITKKYNPEEGELDMK